MYASQINRNFRKYDGNSSMVGIDHHQNGILMWIMNIICISITMTNVDAILKILLLLLSIGYTGRLWYISEKSKWRKKTGDDLPST